MDRGSVGCMTGLFLAPDAEPSSEPKLAFHSRAEQFVPLCEVAVVIGVRATTVRRMIWRREIRARNRSNGRGWEVDVTTLPPKYRVAFVVHEAETTTVSPRFTGGRQTARERATDRLEAVLTLRKARALRAPGESLAAAEHHWFINFRRTHPWMKVSIRSAKAWDAAYEKDGRNIDALIDGNDREGTGQRIPARLKRAFKDEFLRTQRPNIQLCYDNVVDTARANGWGPVPSYDTFWRYAKRLPRLVRAINRESADRPREVLPYVVRDPETLDAYHTVQSDIRQLDVPVRCTKGCDVCTGKKPKGHFPFWIAFIDIRSRRILATELSIDTPDSRQILGVFRRMTDENGLTWRVYLDNGANYRKAFGQALRRQGKTEWDGPTEGQLQARFAPLGIEVIYALPYNAQAKLIERMFRTFRQRFDEDFEAYRGTPGERSEIAKELYYRPHELPTLGDLAYLLDLSVEKYNSITPHTGRGMDGRTPTEVFDAHRIARREPDEAWAFLFFDRVSGGREVGRNGVQYDKRTYRLASLEKHLLYFGERVDMRVNPDDPRVAAIFDERTGRYVCKATVEAEATYSTRDEVTRKIIARVFRDCAELERLAKQEVEGARERLAEYRRARVAHLAACVQEMRSARQARLAVDSVTPALVMVAGMSADQRVAVHEFATDAPDQITVNDFVEVLDAEEGAPSALCVAAPRRTRAPKSPATWTRNVGELSYEAIADLLGVSRRNLRRYRNGELPWPVGVKERFDILQMRRNGAASDDVPAVLPMPPRPRQTRVPRAYSGWSYTKIAAHLGISRNSLRLYRSGKQPWPAGLREEYEELERQRIAHIDAAS